VVEFEFSLGRRNKDDSGAAAIRDRIYAAVGGRTGLETHVRARCEGIYGRRLSEREVRDNADVLIAGIQYEWTEHGGESSDGPSPAFVWNVIEQWEDALEAGTTTSLAERLFGAGFFAVWFGFLVNAAIGVRYAVAVGLLMAIVCFALWPRWKRRGRIEWGD
jgi:hypothetical protein